MNQTNGNQQYDRDAEFRHEEQHLEEVVGAVDAEIEESKKSVSEGTIGPDVRSADAVQAGKEYRLRILVNARNHPYFGRIDYSENDGPVRTVYIGRFNLIPDVPDGFVMSLDAPVAQLYFNPTARGYVVKRDGVKIQNDIFREAKVYQKRIFTIEDAVLLDFEDALRLPAPGGAVITSSRMLNKRLSSSSSGGLRDTIETLQPEQYGILAKTDSPVLIVQGAAGSGKSIVALQRIEFMLSPHSNIGSMGRPTSERTIMFGPSNAFLRYVSGFLPELDVPSIRQVTITSWLLNQFSSSVTLKGGEERIFNDLMSNRSRLRDAEIEAHLFKGGLKMKRLLDKYVDELKRNCRHNIRRQASNVVNRLSLNITVADFQRRVEDAFRFRPEPNAARQYLLDILAEDRARVAPRPARMRRASQSEIVAASRVEVERELDHLWPIYDFRREYVRLVSGADMLTKYASKRDLDNNQAGEISVTVSRNATGRSLGVTDLAPALYLDYALNGFTSERFEHIVIDEAQDVSPFEVELLRIHSTNDTFTIMGDLNQGLLRHRSIASWNQFARLFEKGSVATQEMRLTYRNTKQITQYAKRILKGISRPTKMPQPYGRKGKRPDLVRSKNAAEMNKSIAESIEKLRELDDVRSIAVLTKWESAAKDILKSLRSENIQDVSRLEQGGVVETDIVVSPIILTKGLEFDAVIIANAGKNNYNETEFNRMLLYVGCTRARHHLEIHWHGTRSPIVPGTERLAR